MGSSISPCYPVESPLSLQNDSETDNLHDKLSPRYLNNSPGRLGLFEKKWAQKNPSDTKGKQAAPTAPGACTAATANARPQQREPRPHKPNSSQRRSARRRAKFVREKIGVEIDPSPKPASEAKEAANVPQRADDGARAETAMDVERPSSLRSEQEALAAAPTGQ